jgi:hypothetical protein
MMAEFLVLDSDTQQRRVALMDRFGAYHVASVADAPPAIGVCLHGRGIAKGFALMHDPACGQVYRFTILALDCGQARTLQWLHESRQVAANG